MVEYTKRNNKKNFLIDNLRAFAIVIVVFGHSIILYSSQWALYTTSIECLLLDNIKKVINIIQMPLFFLCPDFVFFIQLKEKSCMKLLKISLRGY